MERKKGWKAGSALVGATVVLALLGSYGATAEPKGQKPDDDGWSDGWVESIESTPSSGPTPSSSQLLPAPEEASEYRMVVPHTGVIEILGKGSRSWSELMSGRILTVGDGIKTGYGEYCYIEFSEGHRIWLQPNTEIEFLENDIFYLKKGQVRVEQKAFSDGSLITIRTKHGQVVGRQGVGDWNLITDGKMSWYESLGVGLTVQLNRSGTSVRVSRGKILAVKNNGRYAVY